MDLENNDTSELTRRSNALYSTEQAIGTPLPLFGTVAHAPDPMLSHRRIGEGSTSSNYEVDEGEDEEGAMPPLISVASSDDEDEYFDAHSSHHHSPPSPSSLRFTRSGHLESDSDSLGSISDEDSLSDGMPTLLSLSSSSESSGPGGHESDWSSEDSDSDDDMPPLEPIGRRAPSSDSSVSSLSRSAESLGSAGPLPRYNGPFPAFSATRRPRGTREMSLSRSHSPTPVDSPLYDPPTATSTMADNIHTTTTLLRQTLSILLPGAFNRLENASSIAHTPPIPMPPPPRPLERAEDFARADVLLEGMESMDQALVRRFVALGAGAGEDGSGCAICWEPLLTEEEEPVADDSEKKAHLDALPFPRDPARDVLSLPCLHVFHSQCLLPWFARFSSCPSCRRDVDPSGATLRSSHDDEIQAVERSYAVLERTIRMLGGHIAHNEHPILPTSHKWSPPKGQPIRDWIEQKERCALEAQEQ